MVLYTHSGNCDAHYWDIEANATFDISGMGRVTINGQVGENVVINKSGYGELIINATVGRNVRFFIRGMGDVTFTQRPSEDVIYAIEKTGFGSLSIPEVSFSNDVLMSRQQPPRNNILSFYSIFHSRSSQRIISENDRITVIQNGITRNYVGTNAAIINNELYIDDMLITDSYADTFNDTDSVAEHEANDATQEITTNAFGFFSRFFSDLLSCVAPENKSTSGARYDLSAYSAATSDYISSLLEKPKLCDLLQDIQLTVDETELLQEFWDPITFEYINIPVMLNERVYDLDTLLRIFEKDRLDPFTHYKFILRDIQPARKFIELFTKTVEQIKQSHHSEENKTLRI